MDQAAPDDQDPVSDAQPVTTPAAAPSAPSRRRRRVPPVVIAAAAVLVVVGVALIIIGRNGARPTTATPTTATPVAAPLGSHGQPGAVPGATATPPNSASDAVPVPNLGAFADADALREALRPLDPAVLRPGHEAVPPASSATYTAAQLARCAQVPLGYEKALDKPQAFAGASVKDDPVVVISFSLANQPGKYREIALGQGCTVPLLGIDR